MAKWLLSILFIPVFISAHGNDAGIYISHQMNQYEILDQNSFETLSDHAPKHQKLKAILLTVFLGHFGVHRIYLGTHYNVPVVYSLTLGGGLGLLPLVDLIAIMTTKDLDQYKNSDKVFMWLK